MLMDRSIGRAMFVDAKPNQERRLDRRRVKAEEIERRDSVADQFQQRRGGSQSSSSKMDRQQRAMQKPRGDRGRANQDARISREQSSEDRRTKNEEARGDAQHLIQGAGKSLTGVQFERDQARNSTGAERAENPGAHRHGRSVFENAQHVEEKPRTAEIHD